MDPALQECLVWGCAESVLGPRKREGLLRKCSGWERKAESCNGTCRCGGGHRDGCVPSRGPFQCLYRGPYPCRGPCPCRDPCLCCCRPAHLTCAAMHSMRLQLWHASAAATAVGQGISTIYGAAKVRQDMQECLHLTPQVDALGASTCRISAHCLP